MMMMMLLYGLTKSEERVVTICVCLCSRTCCWLFNRGSVVSDQLGTYLRTTRSVVNPQVAVLRTEMDSLQQVKAWRQTLRHHFILAESRKVNCVSRNDHRIMLRVLVAEAWRNDPQRTQNRAKWLTMLAAVDRDCKNAASIMSIVPDPYNGALAKLSSMMLWNDEAVRQWAYRYNEDELARRKTNQTRVLMALQKQGGLFLRPSQ